MQLNLYEKKMECPVCENKFKTMRVMNSKLRVKSTDTDLFKRYKDIEEHPVKYEPIVCPKCGYSAVEKHFNSINKRGISIVKEHIMYKWTPQDFTGLRNKDQAIASYKLALYCAELRKRSKVELGGICLRLAWVSRLYEDSEQEKKYLEMVYKLYNEAYMEEDLMREGTDAITIGYLIGDISSRLGNNEQALKWMNNVLFDSNVSNNRTIEKLARDRVVDLKDILKQSRSTEDKTSEETVDAQ